jgi:hypothetical protein
VTRTLDARAGTRGPPAAVSPRSRCSRSRSRCRAPGWARCAGTLGVPYGMIAIALDEGFTAGIAGGVVLILVGAWLAARPAGDGYGL